MRSCGSGMTESEAVARAAQILFTAKHNLINTDEYPTMDACISVLTPRYGKDKRDTARWHRLRLRVEVAAAEIELTVSTAEGRTCPCGAQLDKRQKFYCCSEHLVSYSEKRLTAPPLTVAQRKRIVTMYAEGLSIEAIVMVMDGVGRTRVRATLIEAGTEIRPNIGRTKMCSNCCKPLSRGKKEARAQYRKRRYCQTQACKNAGRRKTQQATV